MTPQPPFTAILRRAFWPLLFFEALTDLILLLLLGPLLALLLETLVSFTGDPFIGNTELISFALSHTGIAALATVAMGLILTNALTLGGVSLILWDGRQGLPVRPFATALLLLRRLPVLLVISAWAFAAMLLLASPVLATALAARYWLLSSGDLYFYISTHPPEFLWVVALTGVVAAICCFIGLYLLLRAGLAVPICLLQPVGATQALRQAIQASRGRIRTLMPRFIAVAASLAALWAATLSGLSFLLAWLVVLPISDPTLYWASIGLAIATAVIFAMLAALARASLVLILITDPAADDALPARPQPDPLSGRAARLRVAAMLLLCVAIPGAAVVEAAQANRAISPEHPIAITAHRAGSARAPENTLAALKAAIADHADIVEIDVQETADGEVVLLHDTDLRRVAGVARPIWDMRLDEVRALDVGSWFSPTFHGERVPTLEEFAVASRGRVGLNVELKNNQRGEDLAARVVAVLRNTGVADRAVISSLDTGLLREVRRIAPDIKLGLIVATGVGSLRQVNVDFLALSRRLATPAVIRQLHAAGREVHVWTLDDQASIARAMLDGGDNIITSDTLLAIKVRDWFGGLSELQRMLLRIGRSFATSRISAIPDRSPPDDP
jgi:glycerophosphoryl diester phosphodiesterase